MVVIEHDMDFVRRLDSTVTVLNEGKVLAEGSLAEMEQNEQVMEAYWTMTEIAEQTIFLKVKDLEFAYGEVKVLHGLDLKISEKSITCVMGRNGVGKTTLLRNLVGLEKASSGSIYFQNKDITNAESFTELHQDLDMYQDDKFSL